ncbi:hypothetical protein ACVIF9_009767 [Bradyrhizobium sp. USDA 4350]
MPFPLVDVSLRAPSPQRSCLRTEGARHLASWLALMQGGLRQIWAPESRLRTPGRIATAAAKALNVRK